MNQLSFYKYTIWTLVFINLAVLAFFLFTKPRPPHNHRTGQNFKSEVETLLNLDQDQLDLFHKLANEHNEGIKNINHQQHNTVIRYFETLSNPKDSLSKGEILKQLQKIESKKLELTYLHLEEIKGLLKDSQLAGYKEFVILFTDRILKNKKKPHRPK